MAGRGKPSDLEDPQDARWADGPPPRRAMTTGDRITIYVVVAAILIAATALIIRQRTYTPPTFHPPKQVQIASPPASAGEDGYGPSPAPR